PFTGPDAPAVAGTGAFISTGGTVVNAGIDLIDGDYENASKRAMIKVSTGGLRVLAKNAPGVDEATSRIMNTVITINEKIITQAIEHKLKENKKEYSFMDIINIFIGVLLNILGVLLIKYYLLLLKKKRGGDLGVNLLGAGIIIL